MGILFQSLDVAEKINFNSFIVYTELFNSIEYYFKMLTHITVKYNFRNFSSFSHCSFPSYIDLNKHLN